MLLDGFSLLLAVGVLLVLCLAYLRINDIALKQVPPRVQELSPKRWTTEDFEQVSRKFQAAPISLKDHLPLKTGRRYIITGGSGFLGGWIISHLLGRGESPQNIRNIDIRPPNRRDFTSGPASQVAFFPVDLTNAEEVKAAFSAPWPHTDHNTSESEITVFHTAAIIRFYDRHPSLVPLSAKVNIDGTRNVINASLSVGATVLISTSSTAIAQHASRLFLWPWEKEPKRFVQVLRDDSVLPKKLEDFMTVYSYTKLEGETLVKESDKKVGASGKVMRTGTLRPGSVIYGPGADVLEYFIQQEGTPTFFENMVQNMLYVENCSQAHLCYEQRLIESIKESRNPDIGGQAFTVTDPGQAPRWTDVYAAIKHFNDGKFTHTSLSPTALLIISYLVENYYLARHSLLSSKIPILSIIGRILPGLTGNLLNLQPATLQLSLSHALVDDSRARLPPEQGGLGYTGMYTSLEGVYRCCDEYKRNGSLRLSTSKGGFGHGK